MLYQYKFYTTLEFRLTSWQFNLRLGIKGIKHPRFTSWYGVWRVCFMLWNFY